MKKPLWTWGALLAVTGGAADGDPGAAVTGVSIDTRSLEAGDLFVALVDQRDGHEFVTNAFKAGAAAAVVSETYARKPGDGALLRVADPLAAMADLGRIARFRGGAKVIAVTGSVGKTSTKEALRACLGQVGPVHASEKSYNNHWGVPLTLARLGDDARHAILEIGMNHPGEIAPLARMVAPDVAIVTTVEPVHIGQFGSVEEIADEKAAIFEGLEPESTAIINADNVHRDRLVNRALEAAAEVLTFGEARDADVRLLDVSLGPDGSTVSVDVRGRRLSYRLGAPGRHLVQNSLAVVAALGAVGASYEATLPALATLGQPVGRGARLRLGQDVLLIDESYNASPPSMRAALSVLATMPRGEYPRRIAVVGDMRELGPDGPNYHRALAADVVQGGIDRVYACGPLMKHLFDALPARVQGAWAQNSQELVPLLLRDVADGDCLMVKGSLGTNMAPLVAALKAKFTA